MKYTQRINFLLYQEVELISVRTSGKLTALEHNFMTHYIKKQDTCDNNEKFPDIKVYGWYHVQFNTVISDRSVCELVPVRRRRRPATDISARHLIDGQPPAHPYPMMQCRVGRGGEGYPIIQWG